MIMGALLTSSIAFAVIFGCALLGIYLSLSKDQPREDIKDVMRLSTGLIGTIAALVLSLLIASAKNSYDARNTQIKQITANIVLLDNLFEQYGPDTRNLRLALRGAVGPMADSIWREKSRTELAPFSTTAEAQAMVKKVHELEPNSDVKRA